MWTRIATVAVTLPGFLAVLWVGGWPFYLLVAALAGVGFWEYSRLWQRQVPVPLVPGLAGAVAVVLAAAAGPAALAGALVAAVLAHLTWLVGRHGATDVAGTWLGLGGVLYVGLPLAHWVLARAAPFAASVSVLGWAAPGLGPLLFALLCTWAADIGAYFTGRALGRRKLAPRLSPGKTWEGTAGGLLLAAAVGYLAAPLATRPALPPWAGALLGAALAAAAVVGDLAESALKRHAGVKDSGHLLPGHGGVLDRFDSALFTVPAAYYALWWWATRGL